MPEKLKKFINLYQNLGHRYVAYRLGHDILKKVGLLKYKFPAHPPFQQYLSLRGWHAQHAKFFFDGKESIRLEKKPTKEQQQRYENLKAGKLLFYNNLLMDLGKNFDWLTNIDTGYKYSIQSHWTAIEDYSKTAGDIKFVWEKSRFSFLYDIIRYDFHHNKDCSAYVFSEITSWIDANPINMGPNYRCSQEMSIRLLNWTFALYYYKNSTALTEAVFNKMQYAIYWHLHHIYNNIHFSRITVRNNHAITETLTLYLGGLLFPSLPGANEWKQKGKAWFEEEIAYQIYEDGTFLQYSMNYHRVVVQLLTWGITLADNNEERFSDVVYKRAKKTFQYLRVCMNDSDGYLPNYGANDGAIFFKLNNAHYRDYRPQLQALAAVIGTEALFNDSTEDAFWYGVYENARKTWKPPTGIYSFENGGYYVIREADTLTFIKCGSYKDRPQQADNLHIDIWYKNENILIDGGSYKYNTDNATIKYFSGTESHNTVMIDNNDQMLKGGRFIWYYWSQCESAALTETPDSYIFTGTVKAFTYLNKDITHTRTIVKTKGKPEWKITDTIAHLPAGKAMRQLWHTLPAHANKIAIEAKAGKSSIAPQTTPVYHSSLYGSKEPAIQYDFETQDSVIETSFKIVNP
ncbi:MAG: heparinase [Chitinophagia bacterium]|nr:heparinase [Chitinophagia bacterium]